MSGIFRRAIKPVAGALAVTLPSIGHDEAVEQRGKFAARIADFHNDYAEGVKLANSALTFLKVPLRDTAANHMFEAIKGVEERRLSSTTAATFHETVGFGHSFVESLRDGSVSGMTSSMLGMMAVPVRGTAVNLAASQTEGSIEHEAQRYFRYNDF